jgi:hypothetical protein
MQEDGEPQKLNALGLNGSLGDFAEYASNEFGDLDGYWWEPMTQGSESFGYYADDVRAWVFPHFQLPVVFWRARDEDAESQVMNWLQFHLDRCADEGLTIGTIRPPEKDMTPVGPTVDYSRRRRVRSYAARRITL